MTRGEAVEALWDETLRRLARAPERNVAGQLAAFPLDVPTDPRALVSDAHSAAQLALFDPDVEQ